MARKHPNPLHNPPPASSGEEEEEEEEVVEEEDEEMPSANREGSESDEEPVEEEEEDEEEEEEEEDEEEDEEEEDEDGKAELKIHPQPSDPQEEEEEEDEDEDETESDSDPRSPGASGFTIKEHSKPPPASKTTKENVSPVLLPSKRPAETINSRSTAKKAKSDNGLGEEKKPAANRLWNEADEIALLKGMIEFHKDRGVDPTSDSTAFHEFVKDTLSVESTKNQVTDKLRRLKKKYRNNIAKAQIGEDPVFSRPHDHKAFDLSKQIWGGDSTPKKTPSRKKKPAAKLSTDNGIATITKTLLKDEPAAGSLCNTNDQGYVHAGSFSELYPFLNLSLNQCKFSADMVSKEGADAMASCLRCLDKSELEGLEEDWKKQILAENEICIKRATLLQKQVKLIRDLSS